MCVCLCADFTFFTKLINKKMLAQKVSVVSFGKKHLPFHGFLSRFHDR